MNTRLQVEHPISEMISGIDIVREQLRIAAGDAARLSPERYRACAATPSNAASMPRTPTTFRPSPGRITDYHAPGGLGVRVDSALYQGYAVPPYYDSLIAKLIVHGASRNECLMRLRRALEEYVDRRHRDDDPAAPAPRRRPPNSVAATTTSTGSSGFVGRRSG